MLVGAIDTCAEIDDEHITPIVNMKNLMCLSFMNFFT
jgi:hypothetical protein